MRFRYYSILGVAALAVINIIGLQHDMRARKGIPPLPAPPLPLPHTMSSPDYQRLLYRFLDERRYVALKWHRDKSTS